jgi:hypothetical protein
MLHEAYSNREALEEKIAEARRNRKEAGNKYGEWALFLAPPWPTFFQAFKLAMHV